MRTPDMLGRADGPQTFSKIASMSFSSSNNAAAALLLYDPRR